MSFTAARQTDAPTPSSIVRGKVTIEYLVLHGGHHSPRFRGRMVAFQHFRDPMKSHPLLIALVSTILVSAQAAVPDEFLMDGEPGDSIWERVDDEKVADYVRANRRIPSALLEPSGEHVKDGSAMWFGEESPPPETYIFYCTIYYTPRESGFTEEEGFDMTPATRPGLGGRNYPKDFLRAVRMEGMGKVIEPVNGKQYVAWGPQRWRYVDHPLGNRNNELVPRRSAAVRMPHPVAKQNAQVTVLSKRIERIFGSVDWRIEDTGGGVKRWQLDLYWGEDDPHSPEQLGRPKGTPFQYAFGVPVQIRNEAD